MKNAVLSYLERVFIFSHSHHFFTPSSSFAISLIITSLSVYLSSFSSLSYISFTLAMKCESIVFLSEITRHSNFCLSETYYLDFSLKELKLKVNPCGFAFKLKSKDTVHLQIFPPPTSQGIKVRLNNSMVGLVVECDMCSHKLEGKKKTQHVKGDN